MSKTTIIVQIKSQLRKIFIILLLTGLLIFIIEILMLGFYSLTGSKYFYNSSDASNDCPTSINLSKKHKKIAVFGGSSAVGYASPISFSKILCNFNSNNTVVNFANNGQPFSDFQSEIIKKVMDDYDIIILYAGHNEMWTQVFRRNSSFVWPNGVEVTDPKKVRLIRSQQLDSVGYKSKKLQINYIKNIVIDNSRIYYFLFRAAQRIVLSITQDSSNNVESNQSYPKEPYYKNIFLTDFERKNILTLYKKNLDEIINRLRSNQKLIISTVLVNDLFPPLADIVKADINDKSLEDLNKKLKKIYRQLPDIDFQIIEEFIEEAPDTAHKFFLEGLLCLELSNQSITTLDNNNCFSKLVEARGNDMLARRVLPEINEYIRSISHKNVIVVDPVNDMMKSITSINEYYDYFVDYQHPSILGHTVIAKNLLSALYPTEFILDSFNTGLCKVSGNNIRSTLSPNKLCMEAYETNIRWLGVQQKIVPSFFLYDYYRNKSESNLMQIKESEN